MVELTLLYRTETETTKKKKRGRCGKSSKEEKKMRESMKRLKLLYVCMCVCNSIPNHKTPLLPTTPCNCYQCLH